MLHFMETSFSARECHFLGAFAEVTAPRDFSERWLDGRVNFKSFGSLKQVHSDPRARRAFASKDVNCEAGRKGEMRFMKKPPYELKTLNGISLMTDLQ